MYLPHVHYVVNKRRSTVAIGNGIDEEEKEWYISTFGAGGKRLVILQYNKSRIVGCQTIEWDQVSVEIEGTDDVLMDQEGVEEMNTVLNNNSKKVRNVKYIPEDIGKLYQLQDLLITKTSISTIPDTIGYLSKLVILRMNYNMNLTQLPDSMQYLLQIRHLILYSNAICELPKHIGNCSNLETIIMRSNNLTALPESIGDLTKLRMLVLSDNHITQLPESMSKLTNLTVIYLCIHAYFCHMLATMHATFIDSIVTVYISAMYNIAVSNE